MPVAIREDAEVTADSLVNLFEVASSEWFVAEYVLWWCPEKVQEFSSRKPRRQTAVAITRAVREGDGAPFVCLSAILVERFPDPRDRLRFVSTTLYRMYEWTLPTP